MGKNSFSSPTLFFAIKAIKIIIKNIYKFSNYFLD